MRLKTAVVLQLPTRIEEDIPRRSRRGLVEILDGSYITGTAFLGMEQFRVGADTPA